jgi:glycosidase
MRLVVASVIASVSTLVLAGCPSTQRPPGAGDDDTAIDGGAPDAAPGTPDGGAPVCATAVSSCTTTFTYHGAATSVSLRGDFAADGWTAGVAMTPDGAGGWTATVPAADQQVIVYKLVVDGAWISDPDDPRQSPDGYGGVNSVVRVDCDHCPPRPTIDWRDAVLYFVMIDRFADGDSGNDAPLGLEKPADYDGGDLKGLKQKIDGGYFDALGVNALWITSPFDNADASYAGTDGHTYAGYHGYWPKDLTKVESHIGTLDDLRAVVDAAHAHGMQVIIDYVMNHVHSESPIYAAHKDWFWPDDNGHGGNCVCGDGCDWDNDRLRCWFTTYLPDFNFTVADARKWSVDNAVAWAKQVGADGYRLDAIKHVETSWLTDFRARLNGEVAWDQVFYLVGETFTGDRDLIKSYVNPSTMLDGQFDFPLRYQVLHTMLGRQGTMQDLVGFLDSNASYYGAGAVMSTFLGNHDVPRVIHFAEDAPQFHDWDGGKDRAWTNQPKLPTTANAFQRVATAFTLLLTTPGIPMIYYGDEIGMEGAGDPDNRHMMKFTGLTANQTWLHDRVAALIHARAKHPALRRGNRTTLSVTAETFVYEMVSAGDDVYVAINRGDGAAQAGGLPAGAYLDALTGDTLQTPISIPARTGLVLTAK